MTTAVTASSSSWLTKAATIERRVMPWRRDSDIWATTGHTLPGMYLPSWLAEYTPTDSARPTCWLEPALHRVAAWRRCQLVVEDHHVVEQQAPADGEADAGEHGEQRRHAEAGPADLGQRVGDVGPARHQRQHARRDEGHHQHRAAVRPQHLHRAQQRHGARYGEAISVRTRARHRPPTTLHWSNADVEVHKVVVGPYDNNVFVVRCRQTGEAVLIDAANEHERLLELCRAPRRAPSARDARPLGPHPGRAGAARGRLRGRRHRARRAASCTPSATTCSSTTPR